MATLVLLGLTAVGCSGSAEPSAAPQDAQRPTITVTSFDFPESEILAELYAQALRVRGYPVRVLPRLGPREIIQPALEQGRVDLVPGYLGSGLNFLSEQERVATADPEVNYALLKRALAARGISALAFAPAQDRNGFVVTGDRARKQQLRRISDLRPIAAQLTFGGPPECSDRPLCLQGLRDVYGLTFKRFVPMAPRRAIADALAAGEIDVGMLETTNGNLADHDLTPLVDDRHLQPAENVVPLVRTQVAATYGAALVDLLNAVTTQLTTADLVRMNNQLELKRAKPASIAAEWVHDHPIRR